MWGPELTDRLIGDFSLACLDRNLKTLHLARDHHGTGQMYFHQRGDTLCFSSNLAELLDQFEIALTPNKRQLVQLLGALRIGQPEQTFYEGIFQIPPAHRLEFDGQRWRLFRYWDPRNTAPLDPASREAYDEAFREVLSTAVRCRLKNKTAPAIALSGGLDSTAIAAIAATQLAQDGLGLDSYTSVPLSEEPVPDNQLGNERSLVVKMQAAFPTMRTHWLSEGAPGLLSAIDTTLDITRQPVFAAANCHWIVVLMQTLQSAGNDAVLTGQCGNATISWAGNRSQYLRGLWKHQGIGAWRDEALSFRRAHNLSLATTARKMLLPVLLGNEFVENIKRRGLTRSSLEQATALGPALSKKMDAVNLARSSKILPLSRHHPGFRDSVMLSGVYSPNGVTASLAAAYGVELSDPTADMRLIEFCYALPESHYVSDGMNKRLVRGAMSGLVPDAILFNKKSGIQSSDIIPRLRREQHELTAALDSLDQSPLACECLNLELMRSSFEKALSDNSFATASAARQVFMRGLMAGRFLQRFEV